MNITRLPSRASALGGSTQSRDAFVQGVEVSVLAHEGPLVIVLAGAAPPDDWKPFLDWTRLDECGRGWLSALNFSGAGARAWLA